MPIYGVDYEEPTGAPGAVTVHRTGSEPVTVATFAGTHEYVPFDIRPWPERIEERVHQLEMELANLRLEMAARRTPMATAPLMEAALNWSAIDADSYA